MRFTALAQVPRKTVARGASLPPPTGGWDAISPLANMPPDRAVRLENWFPQTGYVELRRGFARHVDTGTGQPVDSLMAYQGPVNRFLFAASGDTIFDVTAAGTATPVVTGLANARWQHINFANSGGNFLWACNGADDPRYFDGATWSAATVTGVSGTDMILPVAYKNRIWTVLKNSTKAAYFGLEQIQGAATEFDVGGEFSLGGHLATLGVWSTDSNDGPASFLVFVSSYGEVVVYSITDPGTADGIILQAKGAIGSPVGVRSLTKVGADLAVICQDGVLPISKILSYDRAALLQVALTKNIQPVMNQSARDYFTNFGWQLISYPRGTMAILNVPVIEGQAQEQYVMNTVTGAWCRFIGQNANCWEIYDNRPFFGSNNGFVYEADRSASDDEAAISADMFCAFNYFSSRGHQKRWTMCRPLLTTDGEVTPGLALNTDFKENALISSGNSFVEPVSRWDEAIWDMNLWPLEQRVDTRWQTVTGIGYCASVRMKVSVSGAGTSSSLWDQAIWDQAAWDTLQRDPVTLQVNGFDLLMEDGAFV